MKWIWWKNCIFSRVTWLEVVKKSQVRVLNEKYGVCLLMYLQNLLPFFVSIVCFALMRFSSKKKLMSNRLRNRSNLSRHPPLRLEPTQNFFWAQRVICSCPRALPTPSQKQVKQNRAGMAKSWAKSYVFTWCAHVSQLQAVHCMKDWPFHRKLRKMHLGEACDFLQRTGT